MLKNGLFYYYIINFNIINILLYNKSLLTFRIVSHNVSNNFGIKRKSNINISFAIIIILLLFNFLIITKIIKVTK